MQRGYRQCCICLFPKCRPVLPCDYRNPSRLPSPSLHSTGCPPAPCWLPWSAVGSSVSLSSRFASCSWSVTQSCLILCDPWTLAHQAPLSMDFHAPLLETHRGSAAAPLPLAWLPVPCREHEVFCRDTGWRVLPCAWRLRDPDGKCCKGRGNILKSFPELLCDCCLVGCCPMTIMLSLVLSWTWPSPRSSLNSSTEAPCFTTHILPLSKVG